MTTDRAYAAAAHHEAGHVVIAYRLGMRPWRVTLTDHKGNGRFTQGLTEHVACDDQESNVLTAMAGPLAEIISNGEPLEFRGKKSTP